MELQRKKDLSIYYWLSDNVPAVVNVEDGFPLDKELVLPSVSIENMDLEGVPFELGGLELEQNFWRIDIFAKTKTQRDNLGYTLFKELECNIPVYNYDLGFPPSVSPTQIGYLYVTKRKLRPIHVFEDLVEKLYWRSSITFMTHYETI